MGELLYYNEEEEWNRALLLYDAVLKEVCTKLEILNNEFKLAARQTRAALDQMEMPELDYFMKHFLPGFELTLDELK